MNIMYDAFISFNMVNRKEADYIYNGLNRSDIKAFYFEVEREAGKDAVERAKHAVENSKMLLLLDSPDARLAVKAQLANGNIPWLQKECNWAIEANIPIIRCILDNKCTEIDEIYKKQNTSIGYYFERSKRSALEHLCQDKFKKMFIPAGHTEHIGIYNYPSTQELRDELMNYAGKSIERESIEYLCNKYNSFTLKLFNNKNINLKNKISILKRLDILSEDIKDKGEYNIPKLITVDLCRGLLQREIDECKGKLIFEKLQQKVAPDDIRVNTYLSGSYYLFKDFKNADIYTNIALKLIEKEKSLDKAKQSKYIDFEVFLICNKSRILTEQEKYNEAINYLNSLPLALQNYYKIYINKGIIYSEAGKHKEAINYFEKAKIKCPLDDETEMFNLLLHTANAYAQTCDKLKTFETLEECYNEFSFRGYEAFWAIARIYHCLAHALNNLAKKDVNAIRDSYDKAIEFYKNSLKSNKEFADIDSTIEADDINIQIACEYALKLIEYAFINQEEKKENKKKKLLKECNEFLNKIDDARTDNKSPLYLYYRGFIAYLLGKEYDSVKNYKNSQVNSVVPTEKYSEIIDQGLYKWFIKERKKLYKRGVNNE